jgi:glycosyltransferase involved in cell wall biosynthesis
VVASLHNVKTKVAMLTGLGYNFADEERNTAKTITQKLLKFSLGFNKNLKIIFHNDDDRKELLKRNIISHDSKTYVVNGSGVDLNFYTYSKPEVSPVRFLLISRLIKAKGFEEFYEAASILHQKYPDVKFSVVGTFDGKQIDSIHPDLHKQITTTDWIDYTGWVDDVRPFIEKSSVVVLPSYREGTPRSILEGMSMGRAIITTDTAGCRQSVNTDTNSKNGHLIKVKSVTDIVSAMESYIKNPENIIQYGINGRAYAEEKYDVEKVNKDMLSILLPPEKQELPDLAMSKSDHF